MSGIFWSPQYLAAARSTTVEDEKWMLAFNENITPSTVLTVKTGTREYSLESKSKTWNSEGALKRKYS
jgi:hypothetical protein